MSDSRTSNARSGCGATTIAIHLPTTGTKGRRREGFALRWLLAVVLAVTVVTSAFGTPTSVSAADCSFVLGFRTLREMIPDIVGDCLENEHHNPATGDTLQRTTGGLLVWRKSDNWTAFTDGYYTWINGPHGLRRRLNTERFPWERDPIVAAPTSVHCESNPESAVKSHDVDIVRYRQFWTTEGAAVMTVRVRNNCAEPRRIQFRARVYRDESSPPLAIGSPFEDHFGPYEEREYGYGWAGLSGVQPPIEPSLHVVFRWNWARVGADEQHCIEVGASRCLRADPWLRSTIEDLKLVPEGAELLRVAADFGVSIRRGSLPVGALAAYRPWTKTITMVTDLDDHSEFERAAVLAHELRHAVDHAEGKLGETVDDCLHAEERAFVQQSEVWYALWRDTLPQPRNTLQLRLNQTAEAVRYNPDWLSERVLLAYGESCE